MKKLLLILLTFPCLTLAEPTVFGLELRKPLPLPECTYDKYGHLELVSQKKVCLWERQGKASIVFPLDQMPSIGKSPAIGATIKQGTLQGLKVYTPGSATQEGVFSALQQKFGKPSKVSKSTVQNLNGAQFGNINALWEQPDVVVEFWGIDEKIDTGIVWIETPEARSARLSELKKTSGTPL